MPRAMARSSSTEARFNELSAAARQILTITDEGMGKRASAFDYLPHRPAPARA